MVVYPDLEPLLQRGEPRAFAWAALASSAMLTVGVMVVALIVLARLIAAPGIALLTYSRIAGVRHEYSWVVHTSLKPPVFRCTTSANLSAVRKEWMALGSPTKSSWAICVTSASSG
jgi:hypothetical protein